MKTSYSQNVCRELAEQLIKEQAEVQKHQAVVREIKQRIANAKTKLIRDLTLESVFRIKNKEYLIIDVKPIATRNSVIISLDLCENPDTIATGRKFTKKEKELLAEYRMAYDFCRLCKDDGWERYLREIAMELNMMNSDIKLLDVLISEIDFEAVTEPKFFIETDIKVGKNGKMLEDVICIKSVKNNKQKKD